MGKEKKYRKQILHQVQGLTVIVRPRVFSGALRLSSLNRQRCWPMSPRLPFPPPVILQSRSLDSLLHGQQICSSDAPLRGSAIVG